MESFAGTARRKPTTTDTRRAMPQRIEDYALVGDCQTAALVGRDGSIDWLCLPRFDSPACFAALLGTPQHGRWLVAPEGPVTSTRRSYRGETLVLDTTFETPDGAVTVTDFMPVRDGVPNLIRVVEGQRGRVRMRTELVIRFDYGSVVPWVQKSPGGVWAIAGPDSLWLRTPVLTHGRDLTTVARFEVGPGERVPFVLTWHPSHQPEPPSINPEAALADTLAFWREWSARCTFANGDRPAVVRSLVTLKALTYAPTGGIVAAATTSLPEQLGGVRNWDYRFCWLRDATFTLYALISAGYTEEARAWQGWLLRAVAGDPETIQIMYGIAGERRLTEFDVPWLPGYEGSAPVRVGNAASTQFQLDVYGEVLDTLFAARKAGLSAVADGWRLEQALLAAVERVWANPDEGLWEVRGPRRHFTHSKVMAWVAADRAVRTVEQFGLEGDAERWRRLRAKIHAEVCERAFDANLGSFVQSYGSEELDAALLLIPIVGFLPAEDARVRGTLAAIEKRLLRAGFIDRYDTRSGADGLPPGEGSFLACTFWYADNLILQGRRAEARAVFDRLVGLGNDVGLLSEEYDPRAGRLVGNFPQAFSHVGLVNTALNLARPLACPVEDRRQR